MEHVTWQTLLELLSWYPIILIKPLQLLSTKSSSHKTWDSPVSQEELKNSSPPADLYANTGLYGQLGQVNGNLSNAGSQVRPLPHAKANRPGTGRRLFAGEKSDKSALKLEKG